MGIQAIRARSLFVALAMFAMAGAAPAQSFPAKPVRVVTEFVAGSAGDVLARIVVTSLTTIVGQPVILDYRPGAGGALAAELVARATPDGYTLLMVTSNPVVIRMYLAKSNPYDAVKDFTPITTLTEPTVVILAHPSTGIGNMRSLVEYAKKNPGKLSYGTSGIGSTHHLSGEQIRMLAGVDIVHVPYKSLTQALTAVTSGELPLALSLSGFGAALVKSGKLTAVAVVNDSRLPMWPDVAPVSESLPGFRPPPTWTALFGPAGLPLPILQKLHAETMKTLAQPEVRAKLVDVGYTVLGETPQELGVRLVRDRELVGRIVKAARIEPTE
jgi:tripartite-type tricarboxylate transporter receptor subunit TctC